MSPGPAQRDSPGLAFLRRYQTNVFGALCVAGDLGVAALGGLDGNPLVALAGGSLTFAAGASAVLPRNTEAQKRRAASVCAPAFTTGGLLTMAAGLKTIHSSGVDAASLTQTGLGILWTAAPLALYLGGRIATDVRSLCAPARRFLSRMAPAASLSGEGSPIGRLGHRLASAKQNQVGAILYQTACAVIGAGGLETLVEGARQANWHKVDDPLASLAICGVFAAGNAVAGLRSADDLKALPVPGRGGVSNPVVN